MKISLLVGFVTAVFLHSSCTPSAIQTESVVETVASTESIVETVIISEPIPETAVSTETIEVAEPTFEQLTVVPSVSSEEQEPHNQDAPGIRELAIAPRPPNVYIYKLQENSQVYLIQYKPINVSPTWAVEVYEYLKKETPLYGWEIREDVADEDSGAWMLDYFPATFELSESIIYLGISIFDFDNTAIVLVSVYSETETDWEPFLK